MKLKRGGSSLNALVSDREEMQAVHAPKEQKENSEVMRVTLAYIRMALLLLHNLAIYDTPPRFRLRGKWFDPTHAQRHCVPCPTRRSQPSFISDQLWTLDSIKLENPK